MSASKDGIPLMYSSRIDSATGSARTLFIDGRGFVTRFIEQKTSKPAAQNTIFVTLRPNFNVQPSATISILGLTGASPVQAGPLINLEPSGNAFGSSPNVGHGEWLDSKSGLRLFVRDTLLAATDTIFNFNILNPTVGQASPQISMQTNILIIGPQAIMQQPSLLSVDDRAFVLANIRQSSCFPGATNTITAQFSINFDVSSVRVDLSNLVLSISGLVSPSRSSASVDAFMMVETTWSGPTDVGLQFKRFAKWNEKVGLMQLYPALPSRGILRDLNYSVSWSIVNAVNAQDPPASVSIQLSFTDDEDQRRDVAKTMTMSSEALSFLGSVPGDAFPLKVYGAKFTFLAIAQSSPWPAALNTITLTMVASIDIVYQSTITLSGLTGSSGPVSGQISDTIPQGAPWFVAHKPTLVSPSGNGEMESPIESTATWNSTTGTLV